MNYRPPAPNRLWDCWIFPWEGSYHLFHLQQIKSRWGGLGHAISQDLVHWQPLETIEIEEVPGSWESSVGLTGTLIRHSGQFWMFYGARHENVQRIGALISDDLKNWSKHPSNPLVAAAPPYHAEVGKKPPPPWLEVWWRDPHIYRRSDLDCYEALVGARLPYKGQGSTGACIARVRSTDLVHWTHHPPLVDLGDRLLVADVPDLFEINGTWYLTFNTGSSVGRRLDTPTRIQTDGTFYMIGPSPDGPFKFPEDPGLLGSGHGRYGPTVLFTLPSEEGERRLAFHHIGPPILNSSVMPAFALPKYLGQNSDGSLSLSFHSAIFELETRTLLDGSNRMNWDDRFQATGEWEDEGEGLHGHSETVFSTLLTTEIAADLHLSCNIRLENAERCGLVLRVDREESAKMSGWGNEPTEGLAVMLDVKNQEVSLGVVNANWYGALEYLMYDSCVWDFSETVSLRVIARAEFVEVYIDDGLALCVSLTENPQSGAAGCFVEGGKCTFEDFRMAELEPLPIF